LSSFFGNTFTVNQVPYQYDTATSENIFRRRELYSFRNRVNYEAIGLSYVSNDSIAANTALFIADKSSDLIANRLNSTSQYSLAINTSTYSVPTSNFLVTDVFTSPTSTIPYTPLFYKHIISLKNVPRNNPPSDYSLVSGTRLVDMQVVDENFKIVQTPEIILDLTNGIIYNNLANSYDSTTGNSTIYYIQYTYRTGNNVTNFIEILNNVHVYTLATFEDLGPDLTILPGHKVYLADEATSGGYVITLPSVANYAFQISGTTKIQILDPGPLPSTQPWIIKITNGNVFSNGYQYHIAEFLNQSWNPIEPIKAVGNETAIIIASNIIKVSESNIYENADIVLYVDILISDSNDKPLYAFTDNPSLIGSVAANGLVYVVWNPIERKGIRSIDLLNGFIDFDGIKLVDSWKVSVNYFYTETNYAYTLIDFNPLDNPSILLNRVVIFLDPDAVGTLSKTQNLYYLIIDKTGHVIQSNWYKFNNTTQLLLDGNPLFYSEVPSYLTSTYPTAEVFLDSYTLEGSGPILVLGELYVGNNSAPFRSQYIDIRQNGGGIREDLVDTLIKINPEISWFWNVGFYDGTAYPGNASYFVEVPANILMGSNGIFYTNQIKDIVARHTAGGVYPVIKAYGIDPVITSIVPGGNFITITWDNYTEALYNIYYGTNQNGPWTLANPSPLLDIPVNTYTITGLIGDSQYYFFVVGGMLDEHGNWYPISGQPIGPTASPSTGITNPFTYTALTFFPTTSTFGSFGNTFTVI
jgi:hypothetical protein